MKYNCKRKILKIPEVITGKFVDTGSIPTEL